MPICSFCPLLCEFVDAQSIDCSLRKTKLAAIAEIEREPSARVDGRKVSLETAIEKAIELLSKSEARTLSGNLRSVEGSRAALTLASRVQAFVDPSNSENAFKSIPAIQRSGMITASLSEVRFRSDCIVLVGDDRTLDVMPRLANVLFARSRNQDTTDRVLPRVVLLGKWSSANLSRIRGFGVDVASIDIEIDKIPQSLFQWSRCKALANPDSRNVVSNWMSQAKYLTLIWSTVALEMSHADLWIERIFEWIALRNEVSRCVGFPLVNDYVTFQQVCTWITGFPGRVQMNGDEFRYEPHRVLTSSSLVDSDTTVHLQVDESIGDREASSVAIATTILIGPKLEANHKMPRVFIPCGVPGVDHAATFFRVDATVAVEAMDEPRFRRSVEAMSIDEILGKLSGYGSSLAHPARKERPSC